MSKKGLLAEFSEFLVREKTRWLTPILVVFALLALLILLGSKTLAPFIYRGF